MTHGSLFSGIGGFDLAAEWMGWENKFHCEWNEFGQRILKHYWPKAISYDDITKTDFTIHRGRIDILTGGFPCQPYSAAGKKLGKEDDRHLWPEMLRAIREIKPRWVVGENVLGLVNWNGGLVFDEVQTDLEAEGYNVQPYVLPACAANAPHRRDRVWFVAYCNNSGSNEQMRTNRNRKEENERREKQPQPEYWENGSNGNAAYSKSKQSERMQFEQREFSQQKKRQFRGNGSEMGDGNVTNSKCSRSPWKEYWKKESGFNPEKSTGSGWENFPTQSPIHNGNDGFSSRLDGITFPKWKTESIKGGGNAIVPQVAHQIFKAIQIYSTDY